MNGVPFAIILGEDELAQGKVKIKEMGLRDGHPEKDGVLVDERNVAAEIMERLRRKKELDSMTRQAGGLRVVDGIKSEDIDVQKAAELPPSEEPSLATEPPRSAG